MIKTLLVAALVLAAACAARAQQHAAPPPLGSWAGPGIAFTLNGDGSYVYQDPNARLAGDWTWMALTAVGGVLALCYLTPTATQTFHNCIYFSIAWLDAARIRLTEPNTQQSAILQRQ